MSYRTGFVGVLAAGLIAFAAAVVLAPGAVFDAAPALESVVADLDPSFALLALAVLLGLVTLSRGASGRSAATPPPSLTTDRSTPSPGRTNAGFPDVGAELDESYGLATNYETASARRRESGREHVERELRSLAEVVHARRTGRDRDAAADEVRAGEWTDDPRAAAFLAGEDGPTTPITLWLVDLLTGRDPFERGAERTLAAIREAQADGTGGELA